MTDLSPITALGSSDPMDRRFGPLQITELPDVGLASLALLRGANLPAPMGLDLPGPGQSAGIRDVTALWTGPGQWMILAPGHALDDIAAQVATEAPGCAVTDQTDGWTVFQITSHGGEAPLAALMEKLVNLDLNSFAPGSATRTGLHHMSVFVIRRAADRVTVIGMRSLAGALWHALEENAERLEGAST